MNKEQEALDNFLKEYLSLCEKLNTNMQEKMLLDSNSPYNVLKTYLKSIDNANPSEALQGLESYINNIIFAKDLINQKQQLLTNITAIKQALQRLESIDNAEPSEALKTLDTLDKVISPLLEPVLAEYEDDLSDKITANYFALKQALLKAREQEKENELLKEIIKSFFDRGCPLHQYTDKEGTLQIEVDDECSTMHLGKFKDVDLDEKLKEVLE